MIELLRQAIASGSLREPFSPGEAAAAVAPAGWTLPRVRSHLVRHCQGNLAAPVVVYERVACGSYRLLADGPRAPGLGVRRHFTRRLLAPRDPGRSGGA